MDGNIYDQFREVIDRRLGGVRVEAQRKAAAGPPPPAMFRLWQEKEEPPFGVEEVESDEEMAQGLRGGSKTEESIIIESDDKDEEERMEPPSVLFGKMENLLDKMGRYQQKLVGPCEEVKGWKSNIPKLFLYDSSPESAPRRPGVNVVGSCPQSGMRGRPLTPQARLAQAARTRNQAKASASQEPPRREPESGRRKEAVEVEDYDDEEEEDEKLRREEDQRAEQRARKKETRGEVIRNTGPRSIRNRPNPGSFTIEESEAERRRLRPEPEAGKSVEAFSLSLSDVGKAMDLVAAHEMADPDAILTLREQVLECPEAGRLELVYRLPGSGGHSASAQTQSEWEAVENTPPVDEFLDQEEDVHLHINKWSPQAPSCVGYPIWQTPSGYERRDELVLNPFEEEDPWGGKDVQWMMELALARSHSLVEDMRTIEEGPGQVERHEDLMGGMYLLVNTLLQENLDQSGSLNPAGNVDEVPESQDDEFEEGEIKEAFRAEEYDRIYLELGLLLSCEMRLRDASDRAQRILQRYLVRDGQLFVRREVGNPRRVVCGRNRQIDIVKESSDRRRSSASRCRSDNSYRRPLSWNSPLLFSRKGGRLGHRGVQATSDFLKTAMPRGGRGTRPPQRLLGTSGGYERHEPRHRESTPVYDDGDIELFLDSFWDHARRMGWTVAQAMERLRGVGRFEEPVARIRRETTTRSEVECRMQELRPSPVGPDGRPIRLEIENVADFIPAFEWFMQGQGIPRDEWARTLPLWTRKAERALATQVRDMARDWESCRAHLREAFRRPKPPHPRVERRQRSQRQRGPEPREARPSRGGRKALARREEEPEQESEVEERGAYPECGLRPVEFPRFTEGGLRRLPTHTQEEPPVSEGPLRELETLLDISRWRASPQGEEHGKQAEEVPREEVQGRRRERAAVRREALTLIDRHLAAYALEHPDLEEPAPAEPRQEPCQPEKEMEAEIPKRVDLRTRERAPAGETAEEKRARRTTWIDEISQERQRLEAAGELPEQQQERQRSEAARALPGQPPSAPARAPEIPEMWRDFWERRGEELPSPVRVGFGVARKAEERLDSKIKFLPKTTFGRHLLLESDLAKRKMKEASHGVRLEAIKVEIQELRALVASQAAIIESLRQQTQGKVDRPESSRQGEQRQPGQGLPGQPSTVEPRQEPPMGRVILEPEEARAQRQAEREAFEFRAPTEFATLPVAAAGPVVPLAVEEGLPPSNSEPAQGSAEGSMGVLLEAVHTMQEEYGSEEIEEQPMAVPGETLERRPQRLDTLEYVQVTQDLRSRLGSWATGSGSGGLVSGVKQQEVISTATPRLEQQGVVSTLVGSPSSPPPQPKKKKFKRKVDQLCFYCKRGVHLA
ncbi:hypothetical protein CBR_g52333 [Chara braunii]|uniref:Uncharacterized protein n=1 Tax=Chara braunii TaxID=69332 RepID=A0A388K6T1_CHABU|nr:hypothetical protein CBR_g52333 [Chara braunii]|eukprot:GBG65741.1 hypothetical protein CBR_g52333 [Chara braunii]